MIGKPRTVLTGLRSSTKRLNVHGRIPCLWRTAPDARWSRIGQLAAREDGFAARFWLHLATQKLRAFPPGQLDSRRFLYCDFHFQVLWLPAPTTHLSRSRARKHSRVPGVV